MASSCQSAKTVIQEQHELKGLIFMGGNKFIYMHFTLLNLRLSDNTDTIPWADWRGEKKARGRELLGKAGGSKGMGSTGPHGSDAELLSISPKD